MKLQKMYLQGFKSFKDRTTIHFDDEITGIVGPNGCGKSNIVDALFWVMGEQSAKHLRGQKMQDLIFAGSSKYSPSSFAEVTLVLENEEGKFIHAGNKAINPKEISLTRKLYRNGDTEYRINNLPARLKDIQEVFMDTGAGAKSYSIIAQGEINRLVQAKPEERRVMIEEVAGVTKFKLRKKESLKKMEQTERNLTRLADIQKEIFKQLKTLETQSEKAKKAKTLKEKIKKHDLIVSSDKEEKLLTEFKELKQNEKIAKESLQNLEVEKIEIEQSLEAEFEQKRDLESKIEETTSLLNSGSKELALAEQKLETLKRDLHKNSLEQEQLEKNLEEAKKEVLEFEGQRQDLQSEYDKEVDTDFEQEALDNLKEELELLSDQRSEKQHQVKELKKEIESLEKNKWNIQQERDSLSSKLSDLSFKIEDIENELLELDQENQKSFQGIEEFDQILKTQENLKSQKNNELSELEDTRKNLEEKVRDLSIRYKENQKNLHQFEAKLEIHQKWIEDFRNKENQEQHDSFKSMKTFTDLFEVSSEVAPLIESYLGSLLNARFEKTSERDCDISSSEAFIDDLKNKVSKRLQVIKEACSLEATALIDGLTLKDLSYIHFYSHLSRVIILDNVLSKEDLQKVEQALQSDSDEMMFIAPDAGVIQVLKDHVIKSEFIESEPFDGLLFHSHMSKDFKEKVDELKPEVTKLEQDLKNLEEEIDQTLQKQERVKHDIQLANEELFKVRTQKEQILKSGEKIETRLKALEERKHEISSQRIELLEKQEELSDHDFSHISEKQDELSELSETLEDLVTRQEDLKETYLEKKASLEGQQKYRDGLLRQLQALSDQVEKRSSYINQSHEQSQNLKNESEQLKETIELLSANLSQSASELREKEEVLSILKSQYESLSQDTYEAETKLKQIFKQMTAHEKTVMQTQLESEKILESEFMLIKDTVEKYQIYLRDCVLKGSEKLLSEECDLNWWENIMQDSSLVLNDCENLIDFEYERKRPGLVTESKEKVSSLKKEFSSLGQINWNALEEYERQKMRYDFIKEQQDQLEKSLFELQQAIETIDHKSIDRFKKAFHEVNERFTNVFPLIFGGGEARLELVGNINDLDAGIDIIAKPPGKKMQSINLMSGGEKAMTAVSLIFSIFLVKPSPFCLLDEVDAPLDDANVGRFNELLSEMSDESQFIVITHNKKTMELNKTLYGVTMPEPGVSKAVSVQLH